MTEKIDIKALVLKEFKKYCNTSFKSSSYYLFAITEQADAYTGIGYTLQHILKSILSHFDINDYTVEVDNGIKMPVSFKSNIKNARGTVLIIFASPFIPTITISYGEVGVRDNMLKLFAVSFDNF